MRMIDFDALIGSLPPGRLRREGKTAAAMISIYCRDTHGKDALCPACTELLQFAAARLSCCPFGSGKPRCSDCTVHCYRGRPGLRESMREVMRYAGPRMLLRHPVLALQHLLDRFRTTRRSESRPS